MLPTRPTTMRSEFSTRMGTSIPGTGAAWPDPIIRLLSSSAIVRILFLMLITLSVRCRTTGGHQGSGEMIPQCRAWFWYLCHVFACTRWPTPGVASPMRHSPVQCWTANCPGLEQVKLLEFCEGDNGAGLGGGTLPNAGPPAVSPQSAG